VFTPLASELAAAFWPGPLTLVLDRQARSPVSELASAGLGTIAVRSPDHPVARALLAAAERPLAAPSANRSGRMSPTRAEHVDADLGDRVAMILDAGPTAHGLESTVVDARGEDPLLLRPGAVTAESIEAVLGRALSRAEASSARPSSPGQLKSHYAPDARLRLEAREVRDGEALLAFGPDVPATPGPMLNLSAAGDLTEAAANLFASLRLLDRSGAGTIAVMPIPDTGVGEAINDRLRRAAAPRPAG
jgi:L-threonylcarbamoyladenylate synthase